MMTQIIMHTFHVEYSSNEFYIHSIECVHTHSCEGYVPENSCQSDRPHLSSLSIQCMNVQKTMTANAYVCVYSDTRTNPPTSGLIISLCTGPLAGFTALYQGAFIL